MAIDELGQWGLSQMVPTADMASQMMLAGMDPMQSFSGRPKDVFSYAEEQRKQEMLRQQEELKQRLLAQKAMEEAGNEAIRRQTLVNSLLDLSGRTPSVDLGGASRGLGDFVMPQQPMDAIDRLFQQGSQMPKELFDALVQGSLKEQIQPAASPEALKAFFPGMSPEALSGMGRVPQKSLQDIAVGRAKGEDKVNATLESIRSRDRIAQMQQSSKDQLAQAKLDQQSEQFKQRMALQQRSLEIQEQRAQAAGQPTIPAKLANQMLAEAAAAGMGEAQQAVLAASMGYSLAGVIPQSSLLGSNQPKGVVGQPKPAEKKKPQFNLPQGFSATIKPSK